MPLPRRSEPQNDLHPGPRSSPKLRAQPAKAVLNHKETLKKFASAVFLLTAIAAICLLIGYLVSQTRPGIEDPGELELRAAELLPGWSREQVGKKMRRQIVDGLETPVINWLRASQSDQPRFALLESAKFAKVGEEPTGRWYAPRNREFTFKFYQTNPAGGRGAWLDAALTFDNNGRYKFTSPIPASQVQPGFTYYSIWLPERRNSEKLKFLLILVFKDDKLDSVLKWRAGTSPNI